MVIQRVQRQKLAEIYALRGQQEQAMGILQVALPLLKRNLW